MAFSAREFRDAMGCFATGVAVVTGRDEDGEPVGVTVNSFSSVSLSPPLVLFCLDRQADSLQPFTDGKPFAVNILSAEQSALSHRFAQSGVDKWHGVDWRAGGNDCPALPGAVARYECTSVAAHDGGDHLILVGRVDDVETSDSAPLLYFRGNYAYLPGAEYASDREGDQ